MRGVAVVALLLASPAASAPDSDGKLLSLPDDERGRALRELLADPAARQRVRGARLARRAFETGVIDALERALEQEDDAPAARAIQESLDDLRVYRRIELPRREVPPLAAPGGLGPADLQVTVRDAAGRPVGGALVLAYALREFLRWPFQQFARAEGNGVVTLPLARGRWSVVALSPAAAGRGVFLVRRDVVLERPSEALLLRPDAELAIRIEGNVEAHAVHALDPAVAFAVAFPSLGRSERGRFVVETTRESAVDLLLSGRAGDDAHWVAFEHSARAPGEVAIAPTSRAAARLALRPPRHLRRVEEAQIQLRLRAHDATPVVIETRPGVTLFLPPGPIELEHSVVANGLRYVYGPSPHAAAAGRTTPFVLDSPSRAVVFHEVRRRFAGERRVLTAGLLARDANGHFLLDVRAEGRAGRRVSGAVRVFRRGKLVAVGRDDRRPSLFRSVRAGIEETWLASLRYEYDLDLGPKVPTRIPGVESVPVESQHFTGLAPACLQDRLRRALQGAEAVYRTTLRVRGGKPAWKRTGIRIRPVLPPGVGASAGGPGLNFSAANLIKNRWLELAGPWAMPHELLHKFGFGHDDFMQVWQSTVLAAARAEALGSPVRLLKPRLAEPVLAMRRGQTTQEASKHLPYVIAALYGLDPFRGYMDLEKVWKPKLQGMGLSDPESSCAILSEMAGADLGALYRAAGVAIRPQPLAQGRQSVARARPPKEPPAPRDEVAPRDRQRVRHHLRRAKASFDRGALDEAHAALLEAQRAAAKAGRAYLDLCRRLAVDLLQGKAVDLGRL